MASERESLRSDLLAWMAGGTGSFEKFSLRLYQFQFAHNAPYRAYCEALGHTPTHATSWEEVPAVPADAFKSGLPLCCFPPAQAVRTFLTSGTTGEVPGQHHFRELTLYQAAVHGGWRHAKLPACSEAFFASRPPTETPASSLTTMFGFLAPDEDPRRWLATPDHTFDLSLLRSRARNTTPILLFGTTLSLLHLTEASPPLPLPPGSSIFQTGGSKGLRDHHDPHHASKRIHSHFHLPEDRLINEYGMTELSSQFYYEQSSHGHLAPPWMRVRVINPSNNLPVAPGETGYLIAQDLANLDSVQAVRTQDFARAIDHSHFELLGRDPGALPRGCSRASDSFFQSSP